MTPSDMEIVVSVDPELRAMVAELSQRLRSIRPLVDDLVEVTYKAGLLQGKGGLGSTQHQQASERSKKLYQEILALLEDTDEGKK